MECWYFFNLLLLGFAVGSNIFQGWIKGEPTLLLYQGELQHNAMRHQRVAKGEVLAPLHSKGIAAIEDAEAVILETDGSFSVTEKIKSSSGSALVDVKGYPRGTVQI